MKLLFVLPNVAVGGIERVTLALIEQFVRDGVECRLALRRAQGELIEQARSLAPVDELAPRGMHQFISALARVIKREQPTHVITAFSDVAVLTWIALKFARSHAKWLHSVHSSHSTAGFRQGFLGGIRSRFENCMAGLAYRRADAVVTVSEGVRREVLDNYGIEPSRVTTIYNPVVDDDQLQQLQRLPRDQINRRQLVSVGRLVKLKGFDILIRAMAQVPGHWHLDIWGDGPEWPHLESMIAHFGMQQKIQLRGYTADPYAVMCRAGLFVLSSRHEGLSNVLIEAIACQCQVVATDCPHGPREILQNGRLGSLVPVEDPVALADAITRAIAGENFVESRLLLERARDFSKSASCARWLELLTGL